MASSRRTTMPWALAFVVLVTMGLLVAVSSAQSEGSVTPPAGKDSDLAASWTLEKESSVASVAVGDAIVYTVVIENSGAGTGTVAAVSDTLPSGFTFEAMLAASDVSTEPVQADGVLTWATPIVVPEGESRRLVYRVRAGAMGLKENRVEAKTADGESLGPETATVTVNSAHIYLPLAVRMEPPPITLPFADDFGSNMSSDWDVLDGPFGPYADDWFHDPTGRGIYWFGFPKNTSWKRFALSMYQAPGSQLWTDYQIVTTIKDSRSGSDSGGLAGVWVRGTYQNGQIGGYYIVFKRRDDIAQLFRFRPGAQTLDDVDLIVPSFSDDLGGGMVGTKFYDLKVEVKGRDFRVWGKEEEDSDSRYTLMLTWTDTSDTYPRGTVGLVAYKALAIFDDIEVTALPTGGQ